MLLRGRVLAVVLTVIMMLTVGLMMLAPASGDAFPGRNGKIVFDAQDAAGYVQIFVMNSDGTGLQQLTHTTPPASNLASVWSPDGKKIAYIYAVVSLMQVWVMNADGSGAHQITSGPADMYPSWSPDGSKIVYQNSNNHLAVVNADGTGTPSPLTTGLQADTYPSWSPDGTKIAFSRGSYLYVLTVATLAVNQLVSTMQGLTPCWSPDGSKIVFYSSGGVYVVNANGGTPEWLLAGGYNWPDWSPDGTKIAVSTGAHSIYVMNSDGSGLTELMNANMPDNAADPNWQRLPLVGAPVGGIVESINKTAVFAPYLALFGVLAVVVVAWKKREN